jgi:NitT/TauT family transport system substrate-binding protein
MTVVKFAGPPDPNGMFVQMAYGVKEGIFKKHGIDLQISYPSQSSLALLDNDTFNMMAADPIQMIAEYEAGVKLLSPMGLMPRDLAGITLRKADGITSPSQLAGKTLGVPPGSDLPLQLDLYLRHFGVPVNSVKVVNLSLTELPGALVSKKIDGILAYPVGIDPKIAALGTPANDMLFSDAGIGPMSTVWALSAKWAADHESAMPNLVAAVVEAAEGAMKNPEQASRDLIATSPATAPKFSVVLAVAKADSVYMTTPNTAGHTIGWMSPKDWQNTLDFAVQALHYQPMDVTALYTNKYIPN